MRISKFLIQQMAQNLSGLVSINKINETILKKFIVLGYVKNSNSAVHSVNSDTFFTVIHLPACSKTYIRNFMIYDATVTKRSLKIASSRLSIFFVIISVCVTFES